MSTDLCVSRSSNQLATSREEDVDAKKFSLSSDFIVQTGNIRRCNHLQAIVNPTTKQEITTALKCTLNCWNTYNQQDFVLQKDIIPHPKLMKVDSESAMGCEDQEGVLKVKVLVLEKYTPGVIHTAVSNILKAVKRSKVDKLVFELKNDDDVVDVDEKDILMAWRDQEELHCDGFADTLGVAALSENNMEFVINKANVPIGFHEVNETDVCCSMHHPHRRLSADHNIKLVQNEDVGNVLTKKTFQKIMTKVLRNESTFSPVATTSSQSTHSPVAFSSQALRVDWTPRWIAKYTIVDTKTSVIDNTGYAIGARYEL
eukprot:m.53333 g.53333  ORF g.53333 m.53333 type:complete len:315 (-) comp11039_c0_seq2:184-1128(-)